MTTRCTHCHAPLNRDEATYYGDSCHSCEDTIILRWRAPEPRAVARRRTAATALVLIIAACIAGLARLGEW